MAEICLVHLVREKNGLAPFEAFIRSYREYTAGIHHDLLVVFKGFGDNRELDQYYAALDGLAYKSLFVADRGFDIEPYFAAAKQFDYRYFCFLNSYSIILDPDWLAKMHKYIVRQGVGVVGATGSYESTYANRLLMLEALPVTSWLLASNTPGSYLRRQAQMWPGAHCNPFPNYHLRTNAFLISRGVMLKLRVAPIRSKMDAARFESGNMNMTRQIFDMHLKVLVIGRDGQAYEKDTWCKSCTFRRGGQKNLLVADNRTNHYMQADADMKQLLSAFAWGNRCGAIYSSYLTQQHLALYFVVTHTAKTMLKRLRGR